MAVRQIRTCDICQSEGASQHVIALDGVFSSLDLCEKDEKTLDQTLGKYLDVGAEISSREAMKLVQSTGGEELDPAKIREWCAAQNPPIQIGAKGRIPAEIVEKYLAAVKPAELWILTRYSRSSWTPWMSFGRLVATAIYCWPSASPPIWSYIWMNLTGG